MNNRVRPMRILVADDHALIRRGVRGLLREQRGWKVVGEAGNGREAVEQAERLKPDVAILDVSMPELDGLEATRQLRQLAPNTKVLILTMHESKQMVRRVLEAGASGYVLKSDFPRTLVEAVKNLSREKPFLSAKVGEIVLNGFLGLPEPRNEIEQRNETPQTELSTRQPTQRESQIIGLLAAGKANKEIAVELGMSVRTVETHRAKIMWKLGLHSLPQLVQYAARNGLIPA